MFRRTQWLAFGILWTLAGLSACTFTKPTTEVPASAFERDPGLPAEGISKSFFVNTNGEPKTFLCGWAPVTEMTTISQHTLIHNAPMADHCNMEFEITESHLIGKIINPSFPNDRKRWKVGLTIPIEKHYYYEKEKDANGRETNKYVENTSRSHWSARPQIALNLKGMTIKESNYALQSSGSMPSIHTVDDIEWDLKAGFVGFTATYSDKDWGYDSQARIRINFKEFKHNPNFVKTPFNDKNYRHMNILHITGEKVDGIHPILYAARWDVSKTNEIYLVGFPAEFEPLAEKIIEEWNQALEKIGAVPKGHKAFVPRKDKLKYAFDLRYTSLTWISDKKIAETSPLGIAMAHADVRNGELVWGGITVYGGYIEEYIKSNLTSSAVAATPANKNLGSFLAGQTLMRQAPPRNLKISNFSQVEKSVLAANLSKEISRQRNHSQPAANKTREENETLINAAMLEKMHNHATEVVGQLNDRMGHPRAYDGYLQKMTSVLGINAQVSDAEKVKEQTEQLKRWSQDRLSRQGKGAFHCMERTFADVSSQWNQALAGGVDYTTALHAIVKELVSHEYGHFLGLGHQFKESVLPKKDSVPASIYETLKARAEKNQTNMTSVMGYRHPQVEMLTPLEEIVPGEQDILVLNYLYNRKYATYKTGDDHFEFFDIPANGIIPDANPDKPEFKTSYFPQCNDIEASLSVDPYCNRFDRGHDAKTIVEGYFTTMRDGLVKSLFTYTDMRGGNPEYAENALWATAFTTLGRVRLFYDHMRRKYTRVFDEIRNDEDMLFQFSNACQEKEIMVPDAKAKEKLEKTPLLDKVARLHKIFNDNPELKELCQANAYALSEIEKLVTLKASDFTKIDLDNGYIPGGLSAGDAQRDWSRFIGTWNELSAAPLKFAGVYMMSAINPWVYWGGWLMTVPHYDNPQFRHAYSSLYPLEYTKVFASAIRENLFFSRSGIGQSDYTSMGSTVFSTSYLGMLSSMSNDIKKLPANFTKLIRSQSQFELNVVAILVSADKTEGTSNFKKVFKGTVYDFVSGQQVPTSEVFLLPEGQVIARAQNMFLFPMPQSNLRFISDTEAYVLAYRVTYSKYLDDPLSGYSVKTELQQLSDQVINSCIVGTGGERNGLGDFFTRTNEDFKGFNLSAGISTDEEKQNNFLKSIKDNFDAYYSYKKYAEKNDESKRPKPEICREALRGLGLIVSTAVTINGYWIPEVESYLNQ